MILNRRNNITARTDYIVAGFVICLYLLNNHWLKGITHGILRCFFVSYFNDFLCPLFFMAYVNRLLALVGKRIYRIQHILLICFVCGCFWEFFTPLIKPASVTDYFDLCFYCLGGILYWAIHKLFRKNGTNRKG